MNSIVRVFSNFKEFYSEINGATLTGAIDVVVVEQPDGTFLCSPFHVRFGKLGVLRSREKIVDIEVNGEPVDIHMKLGESGEAFFVEEVPEEDAEILPEHMATSPIPQNEFPKSFEAACRPSDTLEDIMLPMPLPRRNSIDFSKEIKDMDKKFENQVSDFSHRRHTDNTLERRDITKTKKEYTTQKIRQEWEQDQLLLAENDNEWHNSTLKLKETEEDDKHFRPIVSESLEKSLDDDVTIKGDSPEPSVVADEKADNKDKFAQEDSKSKKKRRKKSFIKKKNSQRKSSTSSSNGSTVSEVVEPETESTSLVTESQSEASALNDESAKSMEILEEVKSEKKAVKDSPSHLRNLDIHFFSDTEVAGPSGPRLSRPTTPVQSDTEFEVSQREKVENVMTHSASWKWGELPTHEEKPDNTTSAEAKRNSKLSSMFSFMKQSRKQSTEGQGLYLSDLDAEGMDPEVAAMYFPPFSKDTSSRSPQNINEDDRESGNGTSLPQSPSSMELIKSVDSDYDEVKLTDKYLDFVALSLCGGLEEGGPTNEDFERNRIEYSEDVLDRLISDSAKKSIMSNQDQMMQQQQQQQQQQETPRGYWFWRRPTPQNADNDKHAIAQPQGGVLAKSSQAVDIDKQNDAYNASMSSENSDTSEHVFKVKEKYRKSLRLTSEQIESLDLNNGMNEISFSVTTAYQGTSRCQCYLFKWKYSDKVVISDIDGTITKSDVLGHLLPMVGKDWAQIGVAELFSKIEENGYKMLYLSARAIGQAKATREYLRSIRQGDVKLPEGPLLLNPTSLISAFHREVIEKKPEQFKIACLSDISDLFPDKNPFYAGYGNRINDVWAYTAVGIPISRIFTINTKGELKHELTQTFQSTYYSMANIVDQLFPPIQDTNDEDNIEYSSFNYWRDPVDELVLDADGLEAAQPSAKPLATIPEN